MVKAVKTDMVYFSATMTTKKIVEAVAAGIGTGEKTGFDITSAIPQEHTIKSDEIAIFGVPVYAGRVPGIAAERIKQFKGEGSPAVIVAVYGNRDFDDALVELYDIVTDCGFKVISGGAFIAMHSIFPKVGAGRPDTGDLAEAMQFGAETMRRLNESDGIQSESIPDIRGNRPYKVPKSVPLYPRARRGCDKCGACAALCPVGAIDRNNVKGCNEELCISCAHCIAVCPQKARKFRGILYRIVARKFKKSYSEPKRPYIFYR